eukprot:9471423-Ditylum_brightwellii.AAC.1
MLPLARLLSSSPNFLGLCICTIQQNNAKKDKPLLICTDKSVLKEYLIKSIENATQGKKHIGIALNFDGTNVSTMLTLSTSHNVILGGVVSKHCIDVIGLSEDKIKSMLVPSSDIQQAREIKIGVISITNQVTDNTNSYFVFAVQA